MVTTTDGGSAHREDAPRYPVAESPEKALSGGRKTQRYSLLVSVVLLIAALAGLAKGFWILVQPDLPDVNAVTPVALGVRELSDGSPARPQGAGGGATGIGRLALVGIILPGYALVSIDGRPQRAFAIGQEILAGFMLRAIYPDRVLVEHGGTQEFLVLRDARGGGLPYSAHLAQPGGRLVPAPPAAFPEVEQIGRNQYRVAREQVNAQMRSAEFLTDARLDPHPGGGFVVNGIRPDSVYEKLGLQAGDVIRTVNGEPVNTVADAVRQYQQLYQTNQVRLGVVRGGRIVQLSYNLH